MWRSWRSACRRRREVPSRFSRAFVSRSTAPSLTCTDRFSPSATTHQLPSRRLFCHCQDIGGELDQVTVGRLDRAILVLLVHHKPPCFMLPEFLQP